jgi:hypothetical protein
MKWMKMIVAACLPLALTSCFLAPGAFTSTLDLRRDGTFTFAYKGEILFTPPEDMIPGSSSSNEMWDEEMARCYNDTPQPAKASGAETATKTATPSEKVEILPADQPSAGESPTRTCTKAEIAQQKKDFEEGEKLRAERQKREGEEFAAMFGFAPGDDAANQRVAAQLMKQEGWKTVKYAGEGVFMVDYQLVGRVGHDFIFPTFEQNDIVFPFVVMRKRQNGSVAVTTPGLTGGAANAIALRAAMVGAKNATNNGKMAANPRTKGSFTITTDGQILTNNTEDGPTTSGSGQTLTQTLTWEIDSKVAKIPESLISLK